MRALLPYLSFYKRHKWMMLLNIILAIVTLLANIILLTLSSWSLLLNTTSFSGIYHFNTAGVRSAAIIRTVGRYFERLISHDITLRILQNLRVFIFSKLLPLSPDLLTRFQYGELLNRVIADVATLDYLYLRVITPIISTFFTIIVITFGLSFLDLKLAMVLSGIMLLNLLLLPSLFCFTGKLTGEELTELRGEYRQQLTTWLYSQAELAIFGASKRYRTQMENTELNWYKMQYRQFELSALSRTLAQLINGLTIVSILWIATGNINKGTLESSLIVLFVFCSLSIFESLAPVTDAFQYLKLIVASALRISKITDQRPLVSFEGQITEVPFRVELKLSRVSFFYTKHRNILKNISFSILEGEHAAILGHTGCGKSTLLQLLTRSRDPQEGLIFINNKPLTSFSEIALRKTVSVVPQRVHLFNATLCDNLQLANPAANNEKIKSVLESVGLFNLLKNDGLNIWLGEGGRKLSGGELRRLAIARALLHDAPLMLLDEPTEWLDPTTEAQIRSLLTEVMKEKTVLMVTHRLQGLSDFDRIIVMDNGQIVEQGNHRELLKTQGLYYQFIRNHP